jgi:hypothetical protein
MAGKISPSSVTVTSENGESVSFALSVKTAVSLPTNTMSAKTLTFGQNNEFELTAAPGKVVKPTEPLYPSATLDPSAELFPSG